MQYDVVWPRSPLAAARRPLSPRIDGVAGKRIGFMWEYLFGGEELFPALADELRARGADVVSYEVFGNLHGPDEAQLVGEIPSGYRCPGGIDAVVSGVGASGSCTPAVLRASVAAERAGVPSVSIVSPGFERQAVATGRGLGFDLMRLAVLDGHPDSFTSDELTAGFLARTVPQIIEGLTAPLGDDGEAADEPLALDVVLVRDPTTTSTTASRPRAGATACRSCSRRARPLRRSSP